MRKALVVGIDQYDHISALSGCVNDAKGVATMLERNGDIDSTVNFGVEIVTSDRVSLSRRELKDAAIELFKDDSEVALVYFAGHGFVDGTGGFLCAQDCRDGDDGFALNELVTIAAGSSARNKVMGRRRFVYVASNRCPRRWRCKSSRRCNARLSLCTY
jgi:uncharacterized caspase-like protein